MQFYLYILAFIIVMVAQAKVQGAYAKYKEIRNARNLTGAQVAREILDRNGLQDVLVEVSNNGVLSDHYDPTKKIVRLSSDIYYNTSIASISVAAHEVGHAIQHKEHYGAIALRNKLLPAANIASQLGWLSLIIGLMLINSMPYLFYMGIAMLIVIALFQLVTLPVEINASTRAVKLLGSYDMIYPEEKPYVENMLRAAAFTYIAALLATLANILRFILIANSRKRD